MATFKTMNELSVDQITAIWNRGFEGYFIDLTMDANKLLTRIVNDGISLERSIVLFDGEEAVGFVMNGFRMIEGKLTAWNGGTGIALEHRGKGYGRLLMERNMELYREQGADIALLEAFSQNERAIRLYERTGYETIEHIMSLQHEGLLDEELFERSRSHSFGIKYGLPIELRHLPCYKAFAAWQTQWPTIKDGQSVIVYDGDEAVGYALFKRVFGENGQLSAIVLYQCEAAEGRHDAEQIIGTLLSEVYQPLGRAIKRFAMFFSSKNTITLEQLKELGFAVYVEQVHMKRQMEKEIE